MRAKCNREMSLQMKRQKVMNYMSRWDEYRARKEVVVQALVKVHRRREVCRFWHAVNVQWKILSFFENLLKSVREAKEKAEKERAREELLKKQMQEQSEESEGSPTHDLQ